MRTDVTLDRKGVYCPNASYSWVRPDQATARVGDFLTYDEHYTDGSRQSRIGRVIGRVAHAPALGSGECATPEVRGYLLVLALFGVGDFCGERWVDPKDVTRIHRPEDVSPFATWFFQQKLPYDALALRRLNEYGTLCARYIGKADEHVREWQGKTKTTVDTRSERSDYHCLDCAVEGREAFHLGEAQRIRAALTALDPKTFATDGVVASVLRSREQQEERRAHGIEK